jgi:hypothetical protein
LHKADAARKFAYITIFTDNGKNIEVRIKVKLSLCLTN